MPSRMILLFCCSDSAICAASACRSRIGSFSIARTVFWLAIAASTCFSFIGWTLVHWPTMPSTLRRTGSTTTDCAGLCGSV